MTATIHPIPTAPPRRDRLYQARIIGHRVKHRHLGAVGRCSGDICWERETLWLEVETNEGRWWWAARNVDELGPIPVPAPRGRAG